MGLCPGRGALVPVLFGGRPDPAPGEVLRLERLVRAALGGVRDIGDCIEDTTAKR